MTALLGFDFGGYVVAGGFILTILATAYGYYTRTGSGIGEHPVDGRGRSPGAKEPASVSGAGRTAERAPGRRTARSRFSSRGTR